MNVYMYIFVCFNNETKKYQTLMHYHSCGGFIQKHYRWVTYIQKGGVIGEQ